MSSMSSKIVVSGWSSTAILMMFGLCFLNQYCEGKRMCYMCNTTLDGEACLDFPENITTPENPSACKHFCTIKRKEFLNIPGEWIVISLERNCEERPFMFDGMEAENHVKTYYRSCRANLCNGGDGVSSLKYIEDEPDDPDDPEDLPNSSSSTNFYNNYNNHNYHITSIRIFKIYFFAFVAFIFSIT